MNPCMICLKESQDRYHKKCSRRLFGRDTPPTLKTTAQEVDTFAEDFIGHRIAVTGVQRKLSLSFCDKTHERLTIVGGLGGGYILKPQSHEFSRMPEVEHLSMLLAQKCGIQVAPFGLIRLADEEIAYVTKRFDRGGKKFETKFHVEDLCQLAEVQTSAKYRYSHEKLGKVIRKFSTVPGDDCLRYFELTLFSFLIGNADMHLKNFSLLTHDPAFVRLAPAYDLIATRLLLSKKEDPEELALTLNGKKSRLKREDFTTFAGSIGIADKISQRTIDRQCQNLEKQYDLIRRSFLSAQQKEAFVGLIAERVGRILG